MQMTVGASPQGHSSAISSFFLILSSEKLQSMNYKKNLLLLGFYTVTMLLKLIIFF